MTNLLKCAIRGLAAAFVLAILLPALNSTAIAQNQPAAVAKAKRPLADTSAYRKHRTARAAIAAPAPRPAWTGADPTKGPGIETVREMQRSGKCIFDEGYGRWTSCSNM